MKWLLTALALLFVLPAHAQGTLPVAMTNQVNQNGQPLAGARLYIYVVGTNAVPQLAFSDINLSLPLPWPVVADQNGRLPMFYLAAGTVHARLTDSGGNVQFDYPNILVIGGTVAIGGGGGGGPSVDPTTVASTGDVKWRLSSETLAGWVILNGQTLGSATSGANNAFADNSAQNLFVYLWTNCPNAHCPVTPSGRGSSALADFNAGAQIQLPDMRDATPVGRDCMGNNCLGGILLSNITSGGTDTADTAQAAGGVANRLIAETNLPHITNIAVTIQAGQGVHNHTLNAAQYIIGGAGPFAPNSGSIFSSSAATLTSSNTLPQMTGTAILPGGSVALPVMNPFKLGTWYQKL